MNDDIVYFELNDWWVYDYYPNAEPFVSWMEEGPGTIFSNYEWVKENELCVVGEVIDMSLNFCITAKREWVNKNCPNLFEYGIFLRYPNDNGEVYGLFKTKFLEYNVENIGFRWR